MYFTIYMKLTYWLVLVLSSWHEILKVVECLNHIENCITTSIEHCLTVKKKRFHPVFEFSSLCHAAVPHCPHVANIVFGKITGINWLVLSKRGFYRRFTTTNKVVNSWICFLINKESTPDTEGCWRGSEI